MLADGAKLLVHGDELGDRVSGVMAGFLLWSGMIDTGPRAISVVERLLSRQMGPLGAGTWSRSRRSIAQAEPPP